MTLLAVVEMLSTFCCALFAGAAVYINLVEHPARMALPTEAALAQWRPSYHLATRMQATLAIVGSAAGLGAWLAGAGTLRLVGALLLGAVVPWTLVVVAPTNVRLSSATLDAGGREARRLLDAWNRLHAVRSVLSVAALLAFVLAGR